MNEYTIFALICSIIILFAGIWLSRKTKGNKEDYFLAGRNVGKWAGSFSASASSESAWVMMGLVGASFTHGLSVLWLIPGCIVGYAFNWFVLAPKINKESKRTSSITIPEMIGNCVDSMLLRYVLSIVIILFVTGYVAAQFFAVGKGLNSITEIDVIPGIIFGTFFVLIYTLVGGMRASVYTDVMQSLLMVGVLIVLPIYAFLHVEINNIDVLLEKEYTSLFEGKSGFALIGLVMGWAGIGLAYPGQPHIHQRFMSMRNPNDMKSAGIIAISWSSLVFLGAIMSGIAGKILIDSPADKELILLDLAKMLTNPIIGGLVIAAIFAAIASTADSQLLSVSSTIKNDLPWINKSKIFGVRIVTFGIAVLAAIFAATKNSTIFDMVLYAWEFLGVSVGSAIIGALLLKRGEKQILISMIVGLSVLMVWRGNETLSGFIYALVPATIAAILVLLVTFRKKKNA